MYRCMCKYVCLEIKKERELLGEGKGVVCLQEGAGTEFCEQGKKKKEQGDKGEEEGIALPGWHDGRCRILENLCNLFFLPQQAPPG